MITVNIYHQEKIGDHKPKEQCSLAATLQVEEMGLRRDFHKCRDTIIHGVRKTDEGDIIEILPFDGCRICDIGQFEVNLIDNVYRRIDR